MIVDGVSGRNDTFKYFRLVSAFTNWTFGRLMCIKSLSAFTLFPGITYRCFIYVQQLENQWN